MFTGISKEPLLSSNKEDKKLACFVWNYTVPFPHISPPSLKMSGLPGWVGQVCPTCVGAGSDRDATVLYKIRLPNTQCIILVIGFSWAELCNSLFPLLLYHVCAVGFTLPPEWIIARMYLKKEKESDTNEAKVWGIFNGFFNQCSLKNLIFDVGQSCLERLGNCHP